MNSSTNQTNPANSRIPDKHQAANKAGENGSGANQFWMPDPVHLMAEAGAGLGEFVGKTTSQMGKAAIVSASDLSSAIIHNTHQTGKAVADTANSLGDTVGGTALQMGTMAMQTAIVMGSIASQGILQTGRTAADLAEWIGKSADLLGKNATQQTQTILNQTTEALEQTTRGTGQLVDFVGNNWFVRKVSGALKLDWLIGISDQVDLKKAQTVVRELQQKYPDESPSQIAHRLMVEKAVYAGGMGLVSSLIPGTAAALLAVDLAATTALQTELVYQIAAAYGLDLQDPARKGEVLGVFGLALGGRQAIKAGLAFLRNVPLAGAMIGSSTNAAMLYSLGYAACRFYEAKTLQPNAEPTSETLDTLQVESDRYLEFATTQEALMDQVLVHMILASYPDRQWEDILPNLAALQLSPASLEAIATSIRAPKPLEELLQQLNRDYAMPLLAQCYRIAQVDGENSTEEAKILNLIAEKFDIPLSKIETMVNTPSQAAQKST